MNSDWNELREDINSEVTLIDETVKRVCQIRGKISDSVRDEMIEPALGTCLMNFYNGVENILKRISKTYYQNAILKSPSWHKELLDSAYCPPKGKMSVFNHSIVERLYQYKNFRHRFISGYGFQLKLEKMLVLVDQIEPLWIEIKNELKQFLNCI